MLEYLGATAPLRTVYFAFSLLELAFYVENSVGVRTFFFDKTITETAGAQAARVNEATGDRTLSPYNEKAPNLGGFFVKHLHLNSASDRFLLETFNRVSFLHPFESFN